MHTGKIPNLLSGKPHMLFTLLDSLSSRYHQNAQCAMPSTYVRNIHHDRWAASNLPHASSRGHCHEAEWPPWSNAAMTRWLFQDQDRTYDRAVGISKGVFAQDTLHDNIMQDQLMIMRERDPVYEVILPATCQQAYLALLILWNQLVWIMRCAWECNNLPNQNIIYPLWSPSHPLMNFNARETDRTIPNCGKIRDAICGAEFGMCRPSPIKHKQES